MSHLCCLLQVADLRDMNDELYEQNKKYRDRVKALEARAVSYPGIASGGSPQRY